MSDAFFWSYCIYSSNVASLMTCNKAVMTSENFGILSPLDLINKLKSHLSRDSNLVNIEVVSSVIQSPLVTFATFEIIQMSFIIS